MNDRVLSFAVFMAWILASSEALTAQRLLVSADSSSGCGASVQGVDPCTGSPTGLFVGCGTNGVVAARSVVTGPGGQIFVADQQNHEIRRFDAGGGYVGVFVPAGLGGLNLPWALAFGPNGNLFASSYGAGPGRVIQYNGSTGALVGTFATAGAADIIEGIVFAPNGNLLASSLQANVIFEFNGTTGALVRTISGGLSGARGMTFGPDGFLYAANANGNSVSRHNFTTGAFSGSFVSPGSGGLVAPEELVFAPNGNLLVSSYQGQAVKEYDGGTGAYLGNLAAINYPIGVFVDWPRGVSVFGQSTPGCAGRPCIGVTGSPLLGTSSFAVTCREAPGSATGVFALSGAALTVPLTISGAGVWLSLSSSTLAVLPVMSDGVGSVSVGLPIPNSPPVAGLSVFSQFAWLDACAPVGVSASRALALTVQGNPPACSSDPYEPNDTCATAAAIPLVTNLSALVCPQNDEDWYQISLPGQRNLSITLTPPQNPCLNYDLDLFGACGSLIASSANAGCLPETLNQNGLCGGIYRIRVRGAAGAWHATAPYTLSVVATNPSPITATVPTSVPVTFTTQNASYPIFAQHPGLLYSFTPTCNETVTVTVTGNALQIAPCLSPWFWARIMHNSGEILNTTSLPLGSSAFTISGTFTAAPGQVHYVSLLVSFYCAGFGSNLGSVPAPGTTTTMSVIRSPQ